MERGCIALFSGGLDSILAALAVKNQGVRVVALRFVSPFFEKPRSENIERILEKNGIRILEKKVRKSYLDMVVNPRFGRGKNMNPCIDCKVYMYEEAARMFKKEKASFIVTGDIVGQRPMTQNKATMYMMDKRAFLKGYVLRPLTALNMNPTVPEKKGIVDRDKLLSLSGRGRKRQIELAEYFGIEDIPQPAGGCLLADSGFSKRVKNLIEHKEFSLGDVDLIKHGRFYRNNAGDRIIIARNRSESMLLWDEQKRGAVNMRHYNIPGAAAVYMPKGRKDIENAASLLSCFGKGKSLDKVEIIYRFAGKESVLSVSPENPGKTGWMLI
ncbi:MAG: tRNA 4-thiouridine(8) synthase ThiI [bacterium]|nr:tRNA 4-thiouridine(8) synthase ThiI [bacterium]